MDNLEKAKKINITNKPVRKFYGELCILIVFASIAALMIWHYLDVGSWAMDKALSSFMSSIRTPLLDSVFRFITATGETMPVVLMTLAAVIILFYFKHRREAALMAFYMLVVWRLNELLKGLIERPRPAINLWLVHTTGSSMPSGHSMNSMALAVIASYFIWTYSKNKKMSIALSIILPAYSVLIGLSRVYLRVHYISDVITGWSLGVACAATAVIIHRLWTESRMARESGK